MKRKEEEEGEEEDIRCISGERFDLIAPHVPNFFNLPHSSRSRITHIA
jgi:hypothetical protein